MTYKYFNHMRKIITILMTATCLVSCKESPIGQTPTDNIPPGQVTNIQVKNTPGGAVITYKIPSDDDLAYIRAEYVRDGGICTDHSSVYNNSLTVEGFSTTNPVLVKLYSVDFSNNKSQPVEVVINPKEAFVHEIFRTLQPMNDIGGIKIKWENELLQAISITLLYSEDGIEYEEKEKYYSNVKNGEYAFRGFTDSLTYFKAYVEDKWGNSSDTLSFEFTPLFSEALNRKIITQVKLPFDCTSQYGHGRWEYCLDGDTFDFGWISLQNNNPENNYEFPVASTFNLNDTAQVMLIKMWMRGRLEYGTGAFKNVEFWGTLDLQTDKPTDYWAFDEKGGWKDDWIFLGSFSTTKPSGPTGTATEEDKLWARENGFEFRLLNAPRVRYVRMLVNSTWSGARAIELCEISFSGDGR